MEINLNVVNSNRIDKLRKTKKLSKQSIIFSFFFFFLILTLMFFTSNKVIYFSNIIYIMIEIQSISWYKLKIFQIKSI